MTKNEFLFVPAILASFTVYYFYLLIAIGTKAEIEMPTKTTFCRAFSLCRQKAQHELSQCSGGILAALAAKQGMLEEGRDGQKCIQEMNKTIGNSIRGLYERVERRALKCAEQHSANPKRELGRDEIFACKAIHLDFLTNFSSPFALLSLRAQQFEDPIGGGPQECVQLYDAQLAKCEALNKCCPELESCLESIEEEIEIRNKEMRVLNLLHKCINEIPIKSKEVIFVNKGKEEQNRETMSAENLDSTSSPIPILKVISTQNVSFSTTNMPSISTISPSTLLPSPDPAIRDLFDFLFPGLAINRQNGGQKKEKLMGNKEGEREDHPKEYLLDNAEIRRKNLGNLVDLVMAKKSRNEGGGEGGMKMERIVEEENGGKMDEPMKGKRGNEEENTENTSFVIGSNSVEDEEDENGTAESSDEGIQTVKGGQSTNLTIGNEQMNSTKSSILEYSRQDRAVAMAVGRIFCENYLECISVKAKLSKNCPLQVNLLENRQFIKANWFSFEQLGKCLEARPLKLLANYFEHSNFCSIAVEFGKNCQMMRECCPSIV